MKKLKKGIALALSLAMTMSLVPSASLAEGDGFYENFESQVLGEAPKSNSYNLSCLTGTGSVLVKERNDNKVVAIENKDEGTFVMLKAGFSELKGAISAGVQYYQPKIEADGNVIMRLMKNDTIVCSVETKDGNIVYRQKTGDVIIVQNYQADTLYSIRLEVTTTTSLADIYLEDSLIATALPLMNTVDSINEYRAYSSATPGFELDNIYVRHSAIVSYVKVEGKEVISIPAAGKTHKYTYKATAFSVAEDEISAAGFEWSISPKEEGVLLNVIESSSAEIIVSDNAAPDKEYTLTAKVSGTSVSAEYKVQVKEAAFDRIEIKGKGSMALALTRPDEEFQYNAVVYDEFGNEMVGEGVTWEISGEGSKYFTFDSRNGVLKVATSADVLSDFTLKATLKSNPEKYAIRKISLIDARAYIADETRRQAIKTYIDTALEYGKDVYNGTPRIADGINRDGEAIKWRTLNHDEIPVADMGNEWELLRTMIAYSDTIGDPFYKERAYELYRFTMENDVADNGLIYWGSHKAIDLRTGEPTGDPTTGLGHYHEIEEKDMYLTPFYEIDPEFTAQLVRNIWMGHVTETKDAETNAVLGWYNLLFNRHAQYTKDIGSEFQALTWDNTDVYDDDYYLYDPFIRTKNGQSPFFVAGSEYISAAVELYEKLNDEKALLWAKRLAYRYANLADKKTGVVPKLTSTPYGDPEIVDENGNISFNIRPAWVDNYTRIPDGMSAKKYGDQVYVQFAKGMEDAGLLEGYDLWEHLPINKEELKEKNNELYTAMEKDGAKALILDMYYYRKWPWAYGRSMFSVLELIETLGLQNTTDEGFELFAKWMRGYKSYLDNAYEGNGKIKVTFASGIKLDGFKTTVPGSESNKGSVLDKTDITYECVLPAISALALLDRFDPSVVIYDGSTGGEAMTVGDVEKSVWSFVNSMSDFYEIGYLGEGRLSNCADPVPNYHTTCDDANALNAVIELYRYTQKSEYLKLARIIANNIVTEKYSGGFFVPAKQYGTWTSSYEAVVLMKLDAIINNTWSDALNFSFQSYVYHQAAYIDDHGKEGQRQHETRHTEEYTKVLPKKIRVNADDITMNVGDVRELEIEVLPDDSETKSYYWEISDQSVVKANGAYVYAVGKGEAVIRAVVDNTDIESADIHITVE